MKYCAECRKGEMKNRANFYVTGTRWIDNERKRPYRAYLCEEHYIMLLDDGDDVKIVLRRM